MVYHYFLYAVDYFWDEETGIISGIKEVCTDHFDIERDQSNIEDSIIQFIRVLARFDFGFIVRIDSNEVVAISERPGVLKLRAKSDSIFDFFTQKYFYYSDGEVHLYNDVTDFIDIV